MERLKRIMIVDDEQMILDILGRVLGGAGYKRDLISNSEWVLFELGSAFKSNEGPFDLMITDYEMPSINGVTLIKTVRTKPDLIGLPIIGMSGTMGAEELFLKVGADGFIQKPFKFKTVLNEVKRVLSLK